MQDYVHGYSAREGERLADQAETLAGLLHCDTTYPPGSLILEAGCGTGAQTIHLAQGSPQARIVSVDISLESIQKARTETEQKGITNVQFRQADIFNLPFEDGSFDHVFTCFVLEHLPDPIEALKELRRVLRKKGTITVIEGDHGSFYSYPESEESKETVQCLIDVQASLGGDSLIGRRLYPLMKSVELRDVGVSPRMVYVDSSRPALVDGFSKKTFIAMVEGVKDAALDMRLMEETAWDKGIADLYSATLDDGTFCYTFFKGIGIK